MTTPQRGLLAVPEDASASAGDRSLPFLADESVLSTAEKAECECPNFCERDHDVD
jgi:hypothetical protein